MYAELQARYPKGTYKLLFVNRGDDTEYITINLCTGHQSKSLCIWDMIKGIEKDLSDNKYPQNTIQYRSWGQAAPAEDKPEGGKVISMDSVKAAVLPETAGSTFIIKVLFRQNATWQGTIQWIEGRQTRQYRSMNELLKLMDEATELAGRQPQG